MFGLPSLQIYGLQSDPSGTKVTSHFLEKFTKSEFYVDSNNTKDAFITANNNTNNTNNNNNNNNSNNNNNNNNNNNSNNYNNNNNSDSAQDKDSAHSVTFHGGGGSIRGGEVDSGEGQKRINAIEENSNQPITETNASDLNKRLSTAEVNLVMQRKKYAKVISFLNQHNLHLEKELAIEKRRRAEELSKIIKSLLCFEAKLKNEKKVINQKLYQSDTEICRLVSLNKVLKQKLGAGVGAGNCGTDIQNDCDIDDALMCPSCRKQFYGIDRSEVWTQTFDDDRSVKDDYTEYASSSDETLSSSFCGARRSIRYTSKRTFGTFQDYMRSRSMSIDDHNYDNSEENASTLSREESQNGYEKMNGFSRKIDRLHGIRRIDSFVIDDTGTDSGNESHRKNGGNVSNNNKRKNNRKHNRNPDDEEETYLMTEHHKTNKVRIKEFAETSPKHDFETSTDDWYASASDVEDSDSVRAKPYGYNAVNPVLECVNQILLQQSMDESLMDGPPSLESSENNSGSGGSHKDTTSSSRKRVHFSTKNSMVHVPRDDDTSSSSPPPPIIMCSDQKDNNNFNYESIYSNEYEPIGSERNSSNHYVDMESKLGQEDHIMVQEKQPKQPPALPPKPANLMKFKRVLRINPTQMLNLKNVEQQKIDERTESEPDYCSISEVSEVVKSVQIVADVHKSADDDISSISSSHSDAISNNKTDDVEEIFADIPKLPNVAAIIAPKTVGKFIANDNYITKSPTKEDGSPKKSHHVPNILAEINKKKAIALNQNTPTKTINAHPMSPSKVNSTPIKVHTEDKLPLQAEFDWYNLDAEYGKSNQPDVIKETDVTNSETDSDEHQHNNVGVEYNLDEEFCLSNQPDIIKENILEPKICPTATICDGGFPTIVEHSPSDNHNETTPTEKVKKSFKDFIDNSGLSTKPLPRQRKIYFSGPFV